jgi:hypothetical protein
MTMFLLPSLPTLAIAAAIAIATSGTLGYVKGRSSGAQAVQARWDAERVAQLQAHADALAAKSKAEDALARQLQAQADAHTQEIQRRDAAGAGARTELARLRDALATTATSRHDPQATPTGPAPDAAAAARDVLGSCAQELVGLGEQADRLAGQLIGLQDYARLAQRTCGTAGQ